MVTRNEVIGALLEELDEAADALKDQLSNGDWSDDAIHVVVADTFQKFKRMECLMEALKTNWNQSR